MALTEPGAGSDLSALRTYGEEQADGTWKLYGEKIFITNGNGDLSLVLAKSEKGAVGLDRLSLFLCPRKQNGEHNFRITKIEEKIGLHASATCALSFEGSWAILLGEKDQGYKYMLHLMNDSRVAVGYQGLGLMEASYRIAYDYAQTRITWQKPNAKLRN
jgi:alkylation response protein AidB-like acyl-CoA dehydrogenase